MKPIFSGRLRWPHFAEVLFIILELGRHPERPVADACRTGAVSFAWQRLHDRDGLFQNRAFTGRPQNAERQEHAAVLALLTVRDGPYHDNWTRWRLRHDVLEGRFGESRFVFVLLPFAAKEYRGKLLGSVDIAARLSICSRLTRRHDQDRKPMFIACKSGKALAGLPRVHSLLLSCPTVGKNNKTSRSRIKNMKGSGGKVRCSCRI